jgi:hypothetical protein
MSKPISEKQLAHIRDQLHQKKTQLGIEDVSAYIIQNGIADLDMASASTVIERLHSLTGPVDLPEGYVGPESERVITNRYSKSCVSCGQSVAEGAGFASLVGGKWITTHRDGDCGQAPPKSGVDLTVVDQFLTATGHGNRTAFFCHPAHADGSDDAYTRQRVKVVLSEKSGWMSVFDANTYAGSSAGFGSKFGTQRPGSGDFNVDPASQGQLPLITAIAADPGAAARAYGHLTGTCAICRRDLESDGSTTGWDSVSHGIGPVCAEKVGLR